MKAILLTSLMLLALNAVGGQGGKKPVLHHHTSVEEGEHYMIKSAEDSVRERLKDPYSARFSNVFISYAPTANVADSEAIFPQVCGQVNAKNSFGGYEGARRFINEIIEGDDPMDFDNTGEHFIREWDIECAGSQKPPYPNYYDRDPEDPKRSVP